MMASRKQPVTLGGPVNRKSIVRKVVSPVSSPSPTPQPSAPIVPSSPLSQTSRPTLTSAGPMKSSDHLLAKREKKLQGSSRFRVGKSVELTQLATFHETAPKDRVALFVEKARQCCITFDFSDPVSDLKSKDIKRIALGELRQYIMSESLVEEIYPEIVNVFSANVLRTLAPADGNAVAFDPDEDDPSLEVAWPHLSPTYELFLSFLESKEFQPSIAKKYIDNRFVDRVLEVFDSEDPRERDWIKTTLHRMYGKLLTLRGHMRRAMNHILFRYIYETEQHNGLSEILEIQGSIINGFAVPLKPEHVQFLEQILLPLHKSKTLGSYFAQLSYCIVQFLEKDRRFTETVMAGLFKLWPRANSPKEVLLLNELEEIMHYMDERTIAKTQESLFRQVARCIASPHFQVAERGLLYFNNDGFVNLIESSPAVAMPILFPALYRHSRFHWSQTITNLVLQSLKILSDISSVLYDACLTRFKLQEDAQKDRKKDEARGSRWASIEALAEKNPLAPKVGIARPRLPLPPPDLRGAVLQPRTHDDSSLLNDSMSLRRKSTLPMDEATERALMDFHLSAHGRPKSTR